MSALEPVDLPVALGRRTGDDAEQLRDRLQEHGQADPEAGHAVADDVLVAALTAIRDGHSDPAALAADALIINSADFPRWCG